MALEFVVEDGTGKTDATTYLSVAELKQQWDNYGYDYSTLTDDNIEVLLNKASKVVDLQYGGRWPGARRYASQRLQWPRVNAYYRDGYSIGVDSIPQEIKAGVIEMAFAINGNLDVQPINTDAGELESERVSVAGAVSESKSYFQGTARTHPKISAVTDALSPLLASSPYGGMDFVRV